MKWTGRLSGKMNERNIHDFIVVAKVTIMTKIKDGCENVMDGLKLHPIKSKKQN